MQCYLICSSFTQWFLRISQVHGFQGETDIQNTVLQYGGGVHENHQAKLHA